jgi:hypothetical protein
LTFVGDNFVEKSLSSVRLEIVYLFRPERERYSISCRTGTLFSISDYVNLLLNFDLCW